MIPASAPRFFVRALGVSAPTPGLIDLVPEARAAAEEFIDESLFDLRTATEIAEAFASGGAPLHVCLSEALRADVAEALARGLAEAAFSPHHHRGYPVDTADLSSVRPTSLLARFASWLATPLAAAFHTALAGAPEPARCISSASTDVIAMRLRRGQSLPVHVDTEEEGVTAVYHLSRHPDREDGGALVFGEPGASPTIVVPQLFGGLFLFRPTSAPHGITEVAAPDDRPRLTVIASYLYGAPA